MGFLKLLRTFFLEQKFFFRILKLSQVGLFITTNNAEPPRNNNRNTETTKKNGTEDNNDKEKSI